MSYMDVMYGPLGQVNNNLQANLGQNAAMNQNQQASMAAQQQAAAAQQAQLAALYGPQGFGGQTAAYAGAGAAYGRNTGYYGDTSGLPPGQAPLPGGGGGGYGYNPIDAAGAFNGGVAPYNDYGNPALGTGYGGAGVGSVGNDWPTYPGAGGRDMSFPAPQPQAAVDWSAAFNQNTAPQSPYANNSGALGGYPDWYSIASGGGGGGYYGQPGGVGNDWGGLGSIPAAAPSAQRTLGYDPSTLYQNAIGYPGGGVSSYFNPPSYGGFGMGIPAATQYQPQQQSSIPDWMSIASGGGGGGYYGQAGNVGNDWGGLMAAGGDQSWLGAGGTQNPYNPFGQINSGQVGQYDAFGGYQPGADFNSRIGNIPGQPYGSGYNDATHGAANSQPQAYNPTYGGGYPGPMASDYQAQQQQMIQDLYKTLGIIDQSGESGRYQDQPYTPSGNTLRGTDYSPNWFQ